MGKSGLVSLVRFYLIQIPTINFLPSKVYEIETNNRFNHCRLGQMTAEKARWEAELEAESVTPAGNPVMEPRHALRLTTHGKT